MIRRTRQDTFLGAFIFAGGRGGDTCPSFCSEPVAQNCAVLSEHQIFPEEELYEKILRGIMLAIRIYYSNMHAMAVTFQTIFKH